LSIWEKVLEASESIHYLKADSDGHIVEFNNCFAFTLKADLILGLTVWDFLVEPDAQKIQDFLSNSGADDAELQLNFCDSSQRPVTIRSWIEKQPDGFTLIGEIPPDRELALNHELLWINNQLTALNRENVRKNRELKRAKQELELALREVQSSRRILSRIQEVLPVCAWCGRKVRSSNGVEWKDVVELFRENGITVSHGLCPECSENRFSDKDGTQ